MQSAARKGTTESFFPLQHLALPLQPSRVNLETTQTWPTMTTTTPVMDRVDTTSIPKLRAYTSQPLTNQALSLWHIPLAPHSHRLLRHTRLNPYPTSGTTTPAVPAPLSVLVSTPPPLWPISTIMCIPPEATVPQPCRKTSSTLTALQLSPRKRATTAQMARTTTAIPVTMMISPYKIAFRTQSPIRATITSMRPGQAPASSKLQRNATEYTLGSWECGDLARRGYLSWLTFSQPPRSQSL